MDAPQIQYCTTPDGVNIAFWVAGDGPPLLYLPPLPEHAELEWDFADSRSMYEWLCRRHRVVRIDPRNTGLSDRGVPGNSLEARRSDLESVVARLGLRQLAIFGHGVGAGVAIAYAAAHPEDVEKLVLVDGAIILPGAPAPPAVRALQPLLDYDWETFTEVLAGLTSGWSSDTRGQYARLFRESCTMEDVRLGLVDTEAHALLPQVKSPTLVVHHRDAVATTIEAGRRLAASIADARLVSLEGRAVASSRNDPRMMVAVDEFLGVTIADAQQQAADEPATPSVTTVLFTDLESSTETTQRLGDAAAQELVRAHNDIVRAALTNHGGREIKHTGDGIMASFASASRAVECAIVIQRAVSAQPGMPRVRIGLNAGEPIAEDGDLFGTTVQLARRICDHGEPGDVLVSNVVRELSAGKGFLFADAGVVPLKGFDEPVRLFALRWEDAAP
jgi:class 3 adenylate cyclase